VEVCSVCGRALCFSFDPYALPLSVLEHIHLNEEETTSSSRIFIKIVFQELAEYMGLIKLNQRLQDPYVILVDCGGQRD